MDTKEKVMDSLNELLINISDKQYQLEVWVYGNRQGVVDTYTDCIEDFLQEFDSIIQEGYAKYNLTKERFLYLQDIYNKLKKFYSIHDEYTTPIVNIITSKEWDEIVDSVQKYLVPC